MVRIVVFVLFCFCVIFLCASVTCLLGLQKYGHTQVARTLHIRATLSRCPGTWLVDLCVRGAQKCEKAPRRFLKANRRYPQYLCDAPAGLGRPNTRTDSETAIESRKSGSGFTRIRGYPGCNNLGFALAPTDDRVRRGRPLERISNQHRRTT